MNSIEQEYDYRASWPRIILPGHFFGLSEEEIQAIEDEFWYGGSQ